MTLFAVVGAVFVMAAWWWVRKESPMSKAARTLTTLHDSIARGDGSALMGVVSVSSGWRGRSEQEIQRDVTELLSGEISVEGIAALKSGGTFGSLREVFPVEAAAWAAAFSVSAEECVAFRMEKDGVRAEVVLRQTADGFRVLRCNNVKQMAAGFQKI